MIKPWKEKHREENKYFVDTLTLNSKKILESCGIWPFGVGKRNREKFSRGGKRNQTLVGI